LKQYKEAIECYDRALIFKPIDYDSLRDKGVALIKMGLHKEAVKSLDKALKIKPDDYNSLKHKGVSLLWLKRYTEAIECYDLSLKINPDDYDSLKGKGIALDSLGMYKEAIESLDQVLRIKPNDDQCLKYKDNILEKIRIESANKSKQEAFKYDIALSFAGENREVVEQIAKKLAENNIQVFYDEFEKTKLWGKRLSTHFKKTYAENTCFVLVFVSKEYSLKDWTNFEFSIARGEAKVRGTEFILPVRLDNTPLFGLPDDMAYLDFNTEGVEGIVSAVVDKLKG
jgi:tetratricopeptide (TPR) repeat protein